MEYAVVLHFNDSSAEQIQKITEHVAVCSDNDYMISNHIPPHITIAGFCTDNDSNVNSIASDIAVSLSKFDIPIVSLGIFNPNVVFAAPVMNEGLLNACKTANHILQAKGFVCNKIYRPYNWVPHISLAVKLNENSVQTAVKAALEKFQPVMATADKLSVAVCNPYKEIETTDL
ncbi:MAG: 2'-5' RNA ligase family protein [Oscillospiraceae bacterium]|nr:2'-5' RNA ligase family protein [Oscillospiraceae bacterium]